MTNRLAPADPHLAYDRRAVAMVRALLSAAELGVPNQDALIRTAAGIFGEPLGVCLGTVGAVMPGVAAAVGLTCPSCQNNVMHHAPTCPEGCRATEDVAYKEIVVGRNAEFLAAVAALSEPSFARIWDNPLDAEYDERGRDILGADK